MEEARFDALPRDVRERAERLMLDDAGTRYAEIAAWLSEQGYPVGERTIARRAQQMSASAQMMRTAQGGTQAIARAVRAHSGLEMTERAGALVMEHVVRALAQAGPEDYGEIPLTKLIELVIKQQSSALSIAKMNAASAREVEAIRRALMDELRTLIRGDEAVYKALEKLSEKAAARVKERRGEEGG